jgi:hypothetical protein
MNMVMNLWVQKGRNFFISQTTISFSRTTLLHGVSELVTGRIHIGMWTWDEKK